MKKKCYIFYTLFYYFVLDILKIKCFSAKERSPKNILKIEIGFLAYLYDVYFKYSSHFKCHFVDSSTVLVVVMISILIKFSNYFSASDFQVVDYLIFWLIGC